VKRPSPASTHEGRGQAVKAEESEGADRGFEPTDTAPANSGRPKAHRQVLTPVLAEAAPEHEHRPRGVRRVGDPPARLTVRGGPRRGRPRAARPPPGRRTESCTLSREQQFAFPRMAGGRLHRPGGCLSPPNTGGRKGSPAHAEATPHSVRSSASARMTKIFEAEGGAEAVARLASPHQTAHW
jgi:hypothetical protein